MKLTPKQKLIELAKMDGCKDIQPCNRNGKRSKEGQYLCFLESDVGGWKEYARVKNYLTSYDAIIPLIQKMCKDNAQLESDFETQCPECWWWNRTPSELCDALLVAKGFEV